MTAPNVSCTAYAACPWRLPPPHVRPSMKLQAPEPPHVRGQYLASPPPVGATNVGADTHVPMPLDTLSPVSPSDDSPPPADHPTAVLDTATADQPRVRRTPPPPPPPPKRHRAAMVNGTTLAPKASATGAPHTAQSSPADASIADPIGVATMPRANTVTMVDDPSPQVRTRGERTHGGWRIKAAELAWVVLNGPHPQILQGRTAVDIAQHYASHQHLIVNYNEVQARCRGR
jgi:hypothetical protein